MRDARVAEFVLALVAPKDRAAAAVGDLLEEAPSHGAAWLWVSVGRTVAAFVWRDLNVAPWTLALSAAVSWLGYMFLVLMIGFAASAALTVAWAAAYALTHHTGFELITDLLRVKLEWTPVPDAVLSRVQLFVLLVAAPLQHGRIAAQHWRERAIAFVTMQSLIWLPLLGLVPLVAFHTRVTVLMLPVIQTFVLIGAVYERRVRLRAAAL